MQSFFTNYVRQINFHLNSVSFKIKNMDEELLCPADQRITDRNLYRSRLINLVRINPILWDKKSPDFNQRLAKIKKWMEVAKELGVSTDKIRRTWENLRDQYRRDLKRTILTGARSKWRFFHDMNFIRSMVRIKPSSHQRQSDSESDYDEFTNDNYHETLSTANMLQYSCQPSTSTAAAAAATTTGSSAPTEFLPIKLNTEWKQRTSNAEPTQQPQQQETPRSQLQLQQQQQIQQNQFETQPQQDCDSSEEQKYADDDEVYEVQHSDISNVIKIEIESDSNDDSLAEVLQRQRHNKQPQQSHEQQQRQQQQQQQQQQQEPSPEPRPSAPRPEIRPHESEEFVTTSESAIKIRKRRSSTQTNAATEDHFPNCYRPQRPLVASVDTELQDEDYHFVMSILPSLRQVTRQRKFPLRSQIMSLISKELEESND